jgi:hypothetical protein
MSDTRPKLITIFCVLIFIRAFVVMTLVAFTPSMRADIPFVSTMTFFFLIIMFGYWTMKRWGLYALGIHAAAFVYHEWQALQGFDPSFLFYALGLVAGIVYFKRMS